MKVSSQNSTFLFGMRARTLVAVLALAVLLGGVGQAHAVPVSVKLTSDALGLGSSDINNDSTVDADMPGFITNPTTGEGSVLSIQTNGLAGPGTVAAPLLVTITAGTHLDVTEDMPLSHDYQAGVIYISKESDKTPDGRDEGLSVRAFTVDGATGLREFDDGSGLAKIEGSKDVSGGTGPDTYYPLKPSGPPHVDESVTFDFVPQFYANALSVVVLLSKFDPTDIVDLEITLTSGTLPPYEFLQTSDTSIFERVDPTYNKLWNLKFSGLSGLKPGDLIDNFTIRANDDEPLHPRGTAEHFLITGMTAEVVPEPSTVALLALGSLSLLRRRKNNQLSADQKKQPRQLFVLP